MQKASPAAPAPTVMSMWKNGVWELMSCCRRYTVFVVGYNWLVAISMLPFALLTVWLNALARESSLQAPVSFVFCAAYLIYEATAFCMERNWSRVSAWRFWRVSAPLLAAHTICCLLAAWDDALGCIIFTALCLGGREIAFELLEASTEAVGYGAKERVIAAVLGGSTYGLIVSGCAGGAYVTVRVARIGAEGLVSPTFEILFALALPVLRSVVRLIVTQSLGDAVLIPRGPLPADTKDTLPPQPQLDTLVMYSDFAFALTVFLEVPLAFAFLYIPDPLIFWLAAITNAVLDVLFVCVLDTLQSRRLQLSALGHAPPVEAPDERGLERWHPGFCQVRPATIIAAAASGAVERRVPNEGSRLAAQQLASGQPAGAREATDAEESGDGANRGRTAALREALGSARDGCCSAIEACNAACLRYLPERSSKEEQPPMSPRVSQLLDEYDTMLIKSRECQPRFGCDPGPTIYLYQERKIPFLAHLCGNTLAVVFAALCVAVVGLHGFDSGGLVMRISALLVLRVMADMAACWVLEVLCTAIPRERADLLWGSRQELSTLHGWFFRMLASLCPLFAVVAAATSTR